MTKQAKGRPPVLVFDLDGTLVDTMGAYADYAGRLIDEAYQKSPGRGRALYMESSGYPFHQQLSMLFPGHAENDRVAQAFEDWKRDFLSRAAPLRPKAAEMLKTLRARGHAIAVSSNNQQENVNRVAAPWADSVDLLLGWRSDAFAKGEPHFSEIASHFGVSRSSMLFSGDSLHDLKIARASALPFVAMVGTFTDAEFRALDEAVACVADLGAFVETMDQVWAAHVASSPKS